MFRALLWKEWRELWVLPAVAVPLATMSFFVSMIGSHRVVPEVWIVGFRLWLFLAAIYIPTHLFSKEREMGAADFLLSRPLDRYRLWCFKMLIGTAALAAVGIILYAVITFLGYSFEQVAAYGASGAGAVRQGINAALVHLSLSALLAVIFRKQLTTIICSIMVIAALFSLGWVYALFHNGPGGLGIGNNLYYGMYVSFKGSLMVWPILLLASLIVFTRGSVWEQSKSTLAFVYSFSAVVALVPTVIGIHHTFPGFPGSLGGKAESVSVFDSSADGERMLLKVSPGDSLVSVDLPERRIHVIESGKSVSGTLAMAGDERIIYTKSIAIGRNHFFNRLFFSDFEGNQKKIFSTLRVQPGGYSQYWTHTWPKESPDGKYLAMTRHMNKALGESCYVAIANAEGEIVRRYDFGTLEGGSLDPVGWDRESRFFFFKLTGNRVTLWTMSPHQAEPEEVDFLPPEVRIDIVLSPDGRWIAGRRDGLWLYDLQADESHLISNRTVYTHRVTWSGDGQMLAYVVKQPGRNNDWNLIAYEPETRERFSILLENFQSVYLRFNLKAWSPSTDYLLLNAQRRGIVRGRRQWSWGTFVLSLKSGQLDEIKPPMVEHDPYVGYRGRPVRWAADDRLIWSVENKVIATEYDGSNPQELFRIENGKFYLYGKEAS